MPIQTNLPPDPNNPQAPNGQNQARTSVTTRTGQTNPPDPKGTLLPNSVKYDITSNQFLAVPLNAGKYTVKARDEGQVVYIAATPDADATLRITKSFNIETPNRTALYIKGQSVIDLLLKDLEAQIGQKADIDTTYTRDQTEALINLLITQAMAGLTQVMNFKGVVPDMNQLPDPNVSVVKAGDVWQARDTGTFYVAKDDLSWEALSGTFVDLNNYYDRAAVDLLLSDKADSTTLAEYKSLVDNFIPPFTYEQSTDPSEDPRKPPIEVADRQALDGVNKDTVEQGQTYKVLDSGLYFALNAQKQWEEVSFDTWTDPTKEGDTWFNPSDGMIRLRKVSQLNGGLFWLNALDNYLALNANKWVTIDGRQTITGAKTFQELPEMSSDVMPTRARQLATKAYVDANGGGGAAPVPADVARLGAVQTFTAQNSFNSQPIIVNQEGHRVLADNKLITKGQVKEMTGDLFLVNPTVTNPRALDDLTDNDLVTKGVITGGGLNGNIDLSNYAKLNAENTFTQQNSFLQPLELQTDPVSGNDATRKAYVDNKITTELTANNLQFYNKTETDTKLQDYLRQGDIANFMKYEGTVVDYLGLDGIQQKDRGDVYYVEGPADKKGFYVYSGTKWDAIGSGITMDTTNLASKKFLEDNTFRNNNIFNLAEAGVGLRFEVGQALKIAGDNNIKLNGDKIIMDQNSTRILQELAISTAGNLNVATFEGSGITFNDNPLLTAQKAMDDLLDSHLVTKWQVNRLIAAGGGGGGGGTPQPPVDTTNLAKLDAANTFQAVNTFNQPPVINAVPVNDTDATRKSYVDGALAGKANVADTYNKTEIDTTLQGYVLKTDITSVMEYKGEVPLETDLPTNAGNGDVYQTQNPAGFWIYNGVNWTQFSQSALQIDTRNLAKLDTANTFTSNNPSVFAVTPSVTAPNADTPNKLISKGEVEAYGYIKAGDNTTFTGHNTFNNPVEMIATRFTDSQLVTKKYVDDAIAANAGAGGGGGTQQPVDTTNLAKLNEANQFAQDNTTTFTNFTDASFVTKKYVDDAINANFTVSDIAPNVNKPLGHIWIKKTFVQDANNPLIFTDIPAMFISVGNNKWWDVHKEELL